MLASAWTSRTAPTCWTRARTPTPAPVRSWPATPRSSSSTWGPWPTSRTSRLAGIPAATQRLGPQEGPGRCRCSPAWCHHPNATARPPRGTGPLTCRRSCASAHALLGVGLNGVQGLELSGVVEAVDLDGGLAGLTRVREVQRAAGAVVVDVLATLQHALALLVGGALGAVLGDVDDLGLELLHVGRAGSLGRQRDRHGAVVDLRRELRVLTQVGGELSQRGHEVLVGAGRGGGALHAGQDGRVGLVDQAAQVRVAHAVRTVEPGVGRGKTLLDE